LKTTIGKGRKTAVFRKKKNPRKGKSKKSQRRCIVKGVVRRPWGDQGLGGGGGGRTYRQGVRKEGRSNFQPQHKSIGLGWEGGKKVHSTKNNGKEKEFGKKRTLKKKLMFERPKETQQQQEGGERRKRHAHGNKNFPH